MPHLCSNVSILFPVTIHVISINVITAGNTILRLQNDARMIVGDDVSVAVFGFVNFIVGLVPRKLLPWFNGFIFLRELEIIIGFQIVYVFLEHMDWNWRMTYHACNTNETLSDQKNIQTISTSTSFVFFCFFALDINQIHMLISFDIITLICINRHHWTTCYHLRTWSLVMLTTQFYGITRVRGDVYDHFTRVRFRAFWFSVRFPPKTIP